MGRMRELTEEEARTASASLNETLVLFTMCIIGLPVEVHVKDGSVYSGIFHTASFDKGYGIALKKARMIKKGSHNANVSNGGLINTLVVLPKDLVQVVAEGVMLPVESVSSATTHEDGGAISGTSVSFQGPENGALHGEQQSQERQVGVDSPWDSKSMKEVIEVHGANTSVNGCYTEVKVCKENQAMVASNQLANGSPSATNTAVNVKLASHSHNSLLLEGFVRPEPVGSAAFGSVKSVSGASHGSLVVAAETPPLTNRPAKESKLNPGAKVFTPSFLNFRSIPPLVPTAQSVAYVPNSIPAVHVTVAQPEVGTTAVAQRSSWPLKYVPYVNPVPTNADNSFQYSQPIAGHITMRAQPMRHGTHYQPIQTAPPYVHANPQNAMLGRQSQVVYVHPVAHDVIQGPAALSQTPHPLLTSHQIHVAKHEGVLASPPLQVSMTPPLTINVPQPFAMPSHMQLSQPIFSSVRPVPVLGSNVPYVAKFS